MTFVEFLKLSFLKRGQHRTWLIFILILLLGIFFNGLKVFATNIDAVDNWSHSRELKLQDDVAKAEKCNPSNNLLLANALCNLAAFYKTIGNWERAQVNYHRALKLRELVLGAHDQLVGATLADMGELEYLQNNYPKAESLLSMALTIEDNPKNYESKDLANTLEKYAKVLYKMNRLSEANIIYSRINKLRATAKEKAGGVHQIIGSTFQKAAQEYNKKNFEAAADLFLQVHKDKPDDPRAVFYLGSCYFSLNQRDSGLETYRTLITNFPKSPEAKQAIAYLKKVAPDFLQKQEQNTITKISVGKSTDSDMEREEKKTSSDCTADNLVVVLKTTGERQNCPPELISMLKEAFNHFPKGVRNLLASSGCKIYITPSTIEMDPRLQNTQPSGYEDGSTWKNCPGYCHGRKVVICAYVMAHDESGWIAADDPLSTLRHEIGHEIDYLAGECSEREEYKHAFLLDLGGMDDETKQELAYYTQKAEHGLHESFAEITCDLLGGGATKKRIETQKLVVQNFPRSVKYVSQLIKNMN